MFVLPRSRAPLPRRSNVVNLSAGRLVEQIEADSTRESFNSRLQKAVLPSDGLQPAPAPSSFGATDTSQDPPSAPPRQTSPAARPDNSEIHEARPAAEPTSAASASAVAPSAQPLSRDSSDPGPGSAAAELARKRAEASADRQRVRALIERDRQERQSRAQERQQRSSRDTAPSSLQPNAPRSAADNAGKGAMLQIRLLDGSTMRNRFASNATLQEDVRSWIDKSRPKGEAPYTFKLILTPHPSRTITAAEESQTLHEAGLEPSASLVRRSACACNMDYADSLPKGPRVSEEFLSGIPGRRGKSSHWALAVTVLRLLDHSTGAALGVSGPAGAATRAAERRRFTFRTRSRTAAKGFSNKQQLGELARRPSQRRHTHPHARRWSLAPRRTAVLQWKSGESIVIEKAEAY